MFCCNINSIGSMELCPNGTLGQWLDKNRTKRDICVVVEMFTQLISAVLYIHSRNTIHRDIKVGLYLIFIYKIMDWSISVVN